MNKRRCTQLGEGYVGENSTDSVSAGKPAPSPTYGQPRTAGPEPGRHSNGNLVAVRDRMGKGASQTWRNSKEIYYLSDRELTLAVSNGRRAHLRKLDLTAEALARFAIGRDSNAEPRIVEVVGVFDVSSLHYIFLEEMQINLNHVVQCAIYPTNSEMVAILVQILDGLVFLAKHNLGHGRLDCHTIFANLQGHVKLANQEYFQEMTPEIGVLNARAMHKITLRLMYKDDPKIENQRQWQSFHNFVDMAASSDSAVKLREEGVLSSCWTKESLVGLFALAEVNSTRRYKVVSEEPGKS
ncbi:serine/threonine protein kinase [Pochonia chlamydosporia 170]|uniref:Serine/threonine protein kinase n=1 Tax=Pochonia chlamydosporia 170 TaxID=1380566 RepID=A0A219AT63_METCM|nr:serine/threonine protein kinase [Pochonia chlamydosporia 170]OWT43375.1 serine/threonine protein kinase [Pochonia chlamydosporia 170]